MCSNKLNYLMVKHNLVNYLSLYEFSVLLESFFFSPFSPLLLKSIFLLWCINCFYFVSLFTFLIFQVSIGQQFVVPSYSMVSLLQQPTKQDSDEELEYADNSIGMVEIPCNFHFILYLLLVFGFLVA